MTYRSTRSLFPAIVFILLSVLALTPAARTQLTFRGGINGTVADSSGALVSGATVEAVEVATNATQKTVSSSAGTFVFPSIPIGKYSVTVSAPGFKREKFSGVQVSAGVIYTLPVKLLVDSSTETVEVSAAAYTLDTTTTTQTTILDSVAVENAPLNGRDFTQLTALTPGFAGAGANGAGSLNGTRTNQINWQIDGVDNNDIWHNIPAINQAGINGIAGALLPIDAIEQFSVQTNASAESGRNPGGTVTLGLKSGTNTLHGSAYYYNRNEALGAKNPFTDNKLKVRNYNAGFSAGGPVLHDHLFYFVTYEGQTFNIGVPTKATEPTERWQEYAKEIVTANGKTVSPISTNLLTLLWPSYALTSSTTEKSAEPKINNYNSPDPETGFSHNGVIKADYAINQTNSISAHWIGSQGNQTAPVGSALKYYYQVGPIHVYNYQVTYNHTFSPSLTNQIVAGTNYFHQYFRDNKTGFDVVNTGLVTGGGETTNAPKIQISGFDSTGLTPQLGRIDVTGQISDNLSWITGKHQFKFGGEFRHVLLNEFYHRNAQGNYKFNGKESYNNGLTNGWDFSKTTLAKYVTDSSVIAHLNALADYLAGYVHSGQVQTGDPERTVLVNTFALFAQDSFQVTRKLNVNYGVRYDWEQPFHEDKKDMSVFRPDIVSSTGLAVLGQNVSSLFNDYKVAFSPRIGFSYQLDQKTVVRAGAGLYYDTPNLNPFLDNRPGNGAPNGVESNPAGTNQVHALIRYGYQWEAGTNQLKKAPQGIFSIQKDFHPSYNINYNFQLEESIANNVIAQLGYVGSQGRHLLSIIDINQTEPTDPFVTGSPVQSKRPYYSKYPDYTNINDIESIGNSNYNSLQATLRVNNLHRFSTQLAYTWSHSFDDVSAFRGALPQDSTNFKGDYGQSDFDNRETFVGTLSYDVPGSTHLRPLTQGWQLNSTLTFHDGVPFTVLTDSQTDNTGENNQRANQLKNPYTGFKKTDAASGYQWLNPDAFGDPAGGKWGTSHRNAYSAPGFSEVDLSVFKNTKFFERVNTQFRVEFYNLLNRTNYAPPLGGGSGGYNPNQATVSTLQLYDTIGDFNGAPGIGEGEPFNTQVALKITF